MTDCTAETVDFNNDATNPSLARTWTGSNAHKTLFRRTLLETFNPYRPAVIDWPFRSRTTTLP